MLVKLQRPLAAGSRSSVQNQPRNSDSSFVMLGPSLVSRLRGQDECEAAGVKSTGMILQKTAARLLPDFAATALFKPCQADFKGTSSKILS